MAPSHSSPRTGPKGWCRGRAAAAGALALSAKAALVFSVTTAPADTVTIPATRDNTIFEESGALSNGAGSWFFAGENNEGSVRRALVAFGVAGAVPAGSTITSVTLMLFCSRTRTGDTDVSLHRVLDDWGEGASNADEEEGAGAAALAGDATWTHRFYPGTSWTSAGSDHAAAPSATAVVGKQNASYSWTSVQMSSDVQLWLDQPATNFGWLVVGEEAEFKVAKRFDSRENPEAATRPKLTVTFDAATATGACCAGDGSCTVVIAPGSGCAGSWQGSGTTCDPNPCPQPAGACCLPDAAATCAGVPVAQCEKQSGDFRGTGVDCGSVECPAVLEPFVDALPVPAVAIPVAGVAGGAATYELSIRQVSQKLHRDLPATTVWGFGDGPSGATFPGPTIEATAGIALTVHWTNDLRDDDGELRTSHYLPVDHCPHGAADSTARTVVHLHGGHVEQDADGYPESTFLPGGQATYEYPNLQLPATLWYHDHALGITRLNVYMGMAGFYLLRDATEHALGLPSGEYEIPVVIQDRTLRPDGSLVYPAEWREHFFGELAVVNGKVQPYLEVKRGKYRLRIANGSTSRTFELALSTGAPFVQIGTDGGLLPAPVPVEKITLASGERADVIVDFSAAEPGAAVFLTNAAPAPYPGGTPPPAALATLMKFVVLGATGHTAATPSTLRALETLDEQDAVVERDFELRKGADACSGAAWLINGLRWDDVTEYPELGTTEIWRFINRSGVTHPMHMHLVMFQVLDRQSFRMSGQTIVPIGDPVPPAASEAGWKDTVQVGPGQIVRVIARFESYKGLYAYHCHILEHEDHEMMRQFRTVSCGDEELDPGEGCDQGALNGAAGSCCTNGCELASAASPCREAVGECDVAESCNESSPLCPADVVVPVGTGCSDDGDVCTDDACDGAGSCAHVFDATNDPTCATTTTLEPATTTTTTTTTTTLKTTTTTKTPTTATTTTTLPVNTTLERTTTTTVPAGNRCGDANGNDEVTAGDALVALRTAVGTDACPLCICDVNASGEILVSDAQAILRVAVGQQVELNCVAC